MKAVSPSKRTSVEVTLDENGAGVVEVSRDGQMVHSFTLMKESGTRYSPNPETVRNAS